MLDEILGLIYMSKYAGMRNDLAQAGGGNTSVKINDEDMLIKSSGFQLADIKKDLGYSTVKYRIIVEELKKLIDNGLEFTEDYGEELLGNTMIKGGRASIETFLHAITGKYTLHSHPLVVGICLSSEEGKQMLKEMYPEAVFIPYRKPGVALAEEYFKKMLKREDYNPIIFLENHGLVVSADSAEEAVDCTEKIVNQIAERIGFDIKAYQNSTKIFNVIRMIPGLSDKIVVLADNRNYALAKALIKDHLWNHRFCPDCVVYCGNEVLYLNDDFNQNDIRSFMENEGNPVILFYKDEIFFVCDSVKKAADISRVFSFATDIQVANKDNTMVYFAKKDVMDLLNWKSEKYRQKM